MLNSKCSRAGLRPPSPEKSFELLRIYFCVAFRRFYTTMTEILLNGAYRLPIIHQLIPGSVAQHVRMYRKRQIGRIARHAYQ